ncbi:putative FBD-associated F-box protein At1g61330 [Miscanthus floridulus]|uniref:putative FBD-associated F-box protein At1g61330 n=1 Tax=Miscanthus floridulus TaxID=154761 RepID=UPI00345820E1
MESHPHQSTKSGSGSGSNRGAMEEEDRLSSLPDDLLDAILRALPLKQAVRTSALSRRWARQWLRALAASRVLDLNDRAFARGQPPARAAATVSRCLRLHAEHGSPLDVLRVALASPPSSGPSDGAFGRDVIGWIAAAVRRGAREVEVDVLHLTPSQNDDDSDAAFLELPGDLFQARNSLERVAFGGLSLRAVRLPAAGLAGLRSLSLSNADVTDEAVRGILAGCRALESLSLRSCPLLTSVSVASERLRDLQLLGCRAVQELRVAAPALESLTLYGHVCWSEPDQSWQEANPVCFDFGDMPVLRDAYLSHLGCGDYNIVHDMAYPCLYYVVAHARVLTLCSIGLLLLYQHGWDESAFREMPKLEELQLLLASPEPCFYWDNEDQEHVSTFFMLTPLPVLQRLFLRLPSDPGYGWDSKAAARADETDGADMTLEHEIVLHQLTFIKVVNFRGTRRELRLLTFFLKRAPSLERLVLLTPAGEKAPADEQLKAMRERVSELQRSSREARVSVRRPKEDDSPNHAHTRFFHEDDEYVAN